MKFNNLLNKKGVVLGFCFLLAVLFLLLGSKCSNLYPFNGWDDFNSFYTVGSGFYNGLLPYRDLFEQKGPLLYFIFMFGYMISPGKFSGVFILEIIFLTFTLYVSSLIIDLLYDNKKDVWGKYFILLLYTVILVTSISFVEGGSSEEFNLLFGTISCYYIIKYFKMGDLIDISYKDLVINGICCGLSLMIKYTMVGLWFIMMAYICIKLIRVKRYRDAILKGLVFILAMLIPFSCFIIYFCLNNGLKDFLDTYFYINIFKYRSDGGLLLNIIFALKHILTAIFSNIFLVIALYSIFCYYLYKYGKKNNYSSKINKNDTINRDKKMGISKIKLSKIREKELVILGMFLFTLIVLYYGQEFRPYAILGVFFIVLLVIIYMYRLFNQYKIFKIGCLIYILISLLVGIDYDYMFVDKKDIVQYRFANIINQEENPTLLQYRSIDEGFYTAAGILPINKYFEQVNISATKLNESYDEQDELIRNKKVMFVIVRKFDLDRNGKFNLHRDKKEAFNMRANLDFISQYYDLVEVYENKVGYYNTCNYYLYKVKD